MKEPHKKTQEQIEAEQSLQELRYFRKMQRSTENRNSLIFSPDERRRPYNRQQS